MDVRDCRVGMRVRSTSDGFTGGMVGEVVELSRGGDPEEAAAFVLVDKGGRSGGFKVAIAVRLLEPVVAS